MPTTVAAVTREHVEAFLISLQEKGHRPPWHVMQPG